MHGWRVVSLLADRNLSAEVYMCVNVFDCVENAYNSLGIAADWRAEVAMILGTGLGGVSAQIDVEKRIPYAQIAGFPATTVMTHAGELLLGSWCGRRVAVFSGRFHIYEGYSAKQVALPVYLARRLGAGCLLVTNCAGGLNPVYNPGEVMLINDHINLLGVNPLLGPNDERLGLRFPDLSEAYCRARQQLLHTAAADLRIHLREGVYVAVTGPSLETNAERRYLAGLGADAVGMSTVIEVIAAKHCDLSVVGLSAISNAATGGVDQQPDTIEAILANAESAGADMQRIIAAVIARL